MRPVRRSLLQRNPRSVVELHDTVDSQEGFIELNPSVSVSACGIRSKPGFHGAHVLLTEFRVKTLSFVEPKQGTPAYLD